MKSLQTSHLFHVFLLFICQRNTVLNRYGKVTVRICRTQATKSNFVRHKKIHSVGTPYCTICSSFPTRFHDGLNFAIAKKRYFVMAKKYSKVPFFSSRNCWLLFNGNTLTKIAQRQKCNGNWKCGCVTVSGRASRWVRSKNWKRTSTFMDPDMANGGQK